MIDGNKIYDELLKVSKTQVRIEEELKHVNKHLGEINGKVHDHCGRIKTLENYKLKTKTIVGVVTVIVSLVWSVAIVIFV